MLKYYMDMDALIKYKFNKSIFGLQQLFSKSDINSVYLFGSFLNGTATKMSDIDLIVVSDIYNGLSGFIRRKNFLYHFSYASLILLDPKCLTIDEFKLYSQSEAFIKENPCMIFCSNRINMGGNK